MLERQRFHTIKAGMQEYRLDEFIRRAEAQPGPGKGIILPFVRGLRFSALLIYAIREMLIGSGLTASWGHLIDEEGIYCSRECDIIIHYEGHISRWNGDGGGSPVMDFKFVECGDAVAVISCKSYLVPSKIETDYAIDLKKYVSKVWLFAECCQEGKLDDTTARATEYEYEKLWTLYTWNRATNDVADCIDLWEDFVHTIKSLKPARRAD